MNPPAPRRPFYLADEAQPSSSSRRVSGGTDDVNTFGPRFSPVAIVSSSRSARYDNNTAKSDVTIAVSEHDDVQSFERGAFEIEDPEFNALRHRSFTRQDNLSETPESRHSRPCEIPVEDEHDSSEAVYKSSDVEEENVLSDKDEESLNDDDDSDFEYEYEDEDDGHFTGFIVSDSYLPGYPADDTLGLAIHASVEGAARIEDEEFLDSQPSTSIQFASLEQTQSKTKTTKWKDISKEAVSMSLRAEKESTGGRRRLASDLYHIMMQDNEESGFDLQPKNEDSMDKWTIRLFKFDEDSSLHEDLLIMGIDHVELEMTFPEQYPFEPPFVRVVRPRFKRQTGFVMNGAICMELLTKDGWNPINDIESVIVSVRSLLVVGNGRLEAVADLPPQKRQELLTAALAKKSHANDTTDKEENLKTPRTGKRKYGEETSVAKAGEYSAHDAQSAYKYLSDYHKEKGWDRSGWWSKKG